MTFGQRLTELRTKKEITQEELAEKLNVSSQTIRRWEYDSTCPDINQLVRLSSVLNVSTEFLLHGKEEAVLSINGKTAKIEPALPKKQIKVVLMMRVARPQIKMVRNVVMRTAKLMMALAVLL